MPHRVVSNLLGLIGGVIGGVVGYYVFFWLTRQNYYGLIIPGAFVGFGCGLLARHRSIGRGVVCGLAGLGLGLFTEWKFEPFIADKSFGYMLTHIPQLRPVTLVMIGAGSAIAFWLGKEPTYPSLDCATKPAADEHA